MEILYPLLVLLVVTRFFGELAERLQQPALVGELVSGILLGLTAAQFPETFPILAALPEDEVFVAISDLGVFFLMLLAGIELQPGEFAKASKRSFVIAIGGMLLPLGLGVGLGWLVFPDSPLRFAQILFLGVALSITAVPVSVKILMDLGKLGSRVGQMIVSAAVVDDVLSLVLLAGLTAAIRTGQMPDALGLLILCGQIVLFLAITFVLNRYVIPVLAGQLKRIVVEEIEFSGLLVVALGYGVLAEALGMHFILGAFVAGLFFVRGLIGTREFKDVERKISGLTKGFLAPVFFASIGLHLDMGALSLIPGLVLMLLLAATFGKVVGAGLPAYAMGMSRGESLAIGVGMNARGAVELIIADIALRAGLFSSPSPTPPVVAELFSAIVIMAIVTTLTAPMALRYALRHTQ